MPNRVTSAKGHKWQRYNRWRSKNRALARSLRLARIAARNAAAVANYRVPRCSRPRVAAFAIVTVALRSGERLRFAIHELPHGLTVSPTLAGRRVQQVLLAARRARMSYLLKHTNSYGEAHYFQNLGGFWPRPGDTRRLIEKTTAVLAEARTFETREAAREVIVEAGNPAGWSVEEVDPRPVLPVHPAEGTA